MAAPKHQSVPSTGLQLQERPKKQSLPTAAVGHRTLNTKHSCEVQGKGAQFKMPCFSHILAGKVDSTKSLLCSGTNVTADLHKQEDGSEKHRPILFISFIVSLFFY